MCTRVRLSCHTSATARRRVSGIASASTAEIEATGQAREARDVELLVRDLGVGGGHRRVLADEHPEAAADHRRDRDVRRDAVVDAELQAGELEALERRHLAL